MPQISSLAGKEDEVVALYLEGRGVEAIGKVFGVKRTAVNRLLTRIGIERRSKRLKTLKLSDEDIHLMVKCYNDGFSLVHIGKLFQVSENTVQRRLKDTGVSIRSKAGVNGTGPTHAHWKGGEHLNGDGYRLIWVSEDDCMASMRVRSGYVLEHRLTMARSIGRPLTAHETVHHIDGDRLNNNLSNLQLRQNSHGQGQVRVCGDCGSHNILCEGL